MSQRHFSRGKKILSTNGARILGYLSSKMNFDLQLIPMAKLIQNRLQTKCECKSKPLKCPKIKH